MVLPPLQPTLGAYVNLLFRRFDLPSSTSGGVIPSTKQKKQLESEMSPPSVPAVPSTLVTAPTFTVPIAPLNTKPVLFRQTVMSNISPSAISPNTRKLVDTLYEGVQHVSHSAKVVLHADAPEVARGRTLTSMPSVSDFKVRPSPTPSPNRALFVRTARPVQQAFRSLKTHGFYIRAGRYLIPPGGTLTIFPPLFDTFYLYLDGTHLATIQCDVDFELDDFAFEVKGERWVLPPGDYLHNIECDFTVTVPPQSMYTIDSYLPA